MMPDFEKMVEISGHLKGLSLEQIADYIEESYLQGNLARKEMASRMQDGDEVCSSKGACFYAEMNEDTGEIYIVEEVPF